MYRYTTLNWTSHVFAWNKNCAGVNIDKLRENLGNHLWIIYLYISLDAKFYADFEFEADFKNVFAYKSISEVIWVLLLILRFISVGYQYWRVQNDFFYNIFISFSIYTKCKSMDQQQKLQFQTHNMREPVWWSRFLQMENPKPQ